MSITAAGWMQRAAVRYPNIRCRIVATDSDEIMLARARLGIYRQSSLRDLPPSLRTAAFVEDNDNVRLRAEMREGIEFLQQDVCDAAPAGRFDLILCRNLAFTYFAMPQQQDVLDRVVGKLHETGFLVLGSHESLPSGRVDVEQVCGSLPIWRRIGAPLT